jgi:ABC-type transport system involved in cytochrome bd biosynthesis fused ATPase/permease subunit
MLVVVLLIVILIIITTIITIIIFKKRKKKKRKKKKKETALLFKANSWMSSCSDVRVGKTGIHARQGLLTNVCQPSALINSRGRRLHPVQAH